MAERRERGRGGAAGRLGFALALVLGLPLLALSGLSLAGPPSPEAAVFAPSVALLVVGGLLAPWRKRASWAARAGLLLLVAVLAYRLLEAGSSRTVTTATGPELGEGRWMDRLVPERDVALGGSMLLLLSGRLDHPEPGLLPALRDGYRRMRLAEGPVPSSVLGTFLLGQRPEDHTVHRVRPAGRFNPPEAVVLFLHGFIGNLTLECWQVAQAANPVGLDVVCPSTEWRARWAAPAGRAIVGSSLRRLREQGVRRIYLAGLSAGAIGASRLVADVDVDGLVLISGVSPAAPRPRVPTLVLQGARDTMTPARRARRYARGAGARYVEPADAGHWLILSHHEVVTRELRRWLAEREGLGEIHD